MFKPNRFIRVPGTEEDYERGKQFVLSGFGYKLLGDFELRNTSFMLGYQKGGVLVEGAIQHEALITAGIPEDDL